MTTPSLTDNTQTSTNDSFTQSQNSGSSSSGNSNYSSSPQFVKDFAQQANAFYQPYAQSINGPNGVLQGYQGNTVAGLSGLQVVPFAEYPQATQGWQAPLQGGLGAIQQGIDVAGQGANYDQAMMQQHMSPYLSGVMDELGRRGNENLTKNIMPSVNSTFAGAGQFGSTRNGQFLNDAISNTQREILGAQATAGNQAWGQAAQDYLGWAKLGQDSAGVLGQLGTSLGQLGFAGADQNMEGLDKMYQMGALEQGQQQKELDAAHNTWKEKWEMPISLMGGLAQYGNTMMGRVSPDSSGSSSSSSTNNSYSISGSTGTNYGSNTSYS
jgi:hypothetical protein